MEFIREKYFENKTDIENIIENIVIGEEGESALDNYTFKLVKDDEVESIKDLFNSSETFLEKASSLLEKINMPWSLRFIYFSIGSLNRQFSYNGYVWLSLNEIDKRLDILEKIGQNYIADLAIKYKGLQKYQILTILKENGMFFIRNDGGSDRNEKRNNWKFTLEFNPNNYNENYFLPFSEIMESDEKKNINYENI